MTGTYDGPVLRHYELRLDIKVRRQASHGSSHHLPG
jgi:hypothetical protein